MPSQFAHQRAYAFSHQNGLCYYCKKLMWLSDPEAYANLYGISVQQAMPMRATAEHLIARCDGGKNTRANIVAACETCNHGRHKHPNAPSAECYQAFMQNCQAK